MDLSSKFNNKVAAKYQIYNSLFLTLPFEEITNTGVLLPVLFKECQEGFNDKMDPTQIVDTFFKKHAGVKKESEKIDLNEIYNIVNKNFDLSPAGLINSLNLLNPIYLKTATYGHFGREDQGFTWEMPANL